MKSKILQDKSAAMEMSMGTIVTIVLLVSVLILGLVFVRNIMCSGIAISDDITDSVSEELHSLFGRQNYGVKCVGENEIQQIGSDGDSMVMGCIVLSEETKVYDFKVTEIKKLEGLPSDAEIESWFSEKEVTGVSVSPGESIVNFITLTPPQKVDKTTLRLKVDITLQGGGTETKYMRIQITPIGALTSTVC